MRRQPCARACVITAPQSRAGWDRISAATSHAQLIRHHISNFGCYQSENPADWESMGDTLRRAAGEIGDLYIRGVGLSAGYWRDDERTRAAISQLVMVLGEQVKDDLNQGADAVAIGRLCGYGAAAAGAEGGHRPSRQDEGIDRDG